MSEFEEKIRGYYAQEKYENVVSSVGDSLLDSINPVTVQYALRNKAAQRLIAMCELIRATSFKYNDWEKWYQQSANEEIDTDMEVADYIEKFNVTVIRTNESEIDMISNVATFYQAIWVAEINIKDTERKEQFLNDYSRFLCFDEILKFTHKLSNDAIDANFIPFSKNLNTQFRKLYYAKNLKHVAIENELLQMLSPKRFRPSSLTTVDFEGRNPFESDYFRIVTSAPIRRLQDKTQIFPQEKSDFVRRRLTHSMEVAAIGRQLGLMVEEKLMEDGYLFKHEEYAKKYSHALAAILETAGLVHDIGNPPFGHFGEDTIQRYFKELKDRSEAERTLQAAQMKIVKKKDQEVAMSVTKFLLKGRSEIGTVAESFAKLTKKQKEDFLRFDGNVQGLRILRHLGLSTDHNSFNLTMPTMAAIIKYPFESKHSTIDGNHSSKKYGYYQAEKETYQEICSTLHIRKGKRHPLAYLLEAADDIVNVTSDVEDGCKMKIIKFADLEEAINGLGIDNLHFDNIRKYEDEQAANGECCVKNTNELLIKEFRIRAVHELMKETVDVFVANISDIINDCYQSNVSTPKKLTNPILGNELLENSKLKQTLSALQKKTYRDPYVLKSELLGEHVITTMLNKFIGCMFSQKIEEKEVDGRKKYYLDSRTAEGKLYALISSNYKRAFNCEEEEIPAEYYHRFLLAVDHVSGMTDSYIVDLYNELTNKKR